MPSTRERSHRLTGPLRWTAAVGVASDSESVAEALTEFASVSASPRAAARRGCAVSINSPVGARRRTSSGPARKWPACTRATRGESTRKCWDPPQRSVWVTTYAFFDGPRAFEVLARRMDETPGLSVTLLLNVQRKKG